MDDGLYRLDRNGELACVSRKPVLKSFFFNRLFFLFKGCVVSVEVKNGGVYEGVLRTVSSKVNQNYIRDEKIFFDLCNTSCKLTADA